MRRTSLKMLLIGSLLALAGSAAPVRADVCFGNHSPPADPIDQSSPPFDWTVPSDASQCVPSDGHPCSDAGLLGSRWRGARTTGGGLVMVSSVGGLWLWMRRRPRRSAPDAAPRG
jgi:hypothetical protein